MSKVTLPIEQVGYNAYGYVGGKRVPVLSTSMGNCWDQDDQRAFCDHIVRCVNYHDRLVEALHYLLDEHPRNGVYHDCTDNGLAECEYCEGNNLLKELEGDK